jgi:hypothetical protein
MPTVFRQDGFEIRIYSNEHNPPHVHVIKAGGELKFILGSESEKAFLDRVLSPMKRRDARAAFEIVKEQQTFLLKKWRDIYER